MFLQDLFFSFINYIAEDPFTQISGFIAMGTILAAYFQKDDYTVKKLMLLSSLFWGTHFYLLWVYAGLASTLIWVVRLLLSFKYEKNIKAFFFVVFLTIIAAYFTVDSIYACIPIITSISGAYSFFFLEKIKLRLAMMFNSILWLVYHSVNYSISWIANEVFTQAILILTVYRMMHPEGWTKYYAQKIKDILWKTSRPDYDRFIFVHDTVKRYRKSLWNAFLKVLHCDLKKSFQKKKWVLCSKFLRSRKDQSLSELTL